MPTIRVGVAGLMTLCSLLALTGHAAAGRDARLVDAVMQQDGAAARALLKTGVDVNAAQGDGATALHWAAHWDDEEMTGLLLGAGAAVNSTNELGVTPLWLACLNASPAMVARLLKAGADPNIGLPSGETPLMTAVRSGNVEVVKLLLAGGADVSASENIQGQTALMWAAADRFPQVVRVLIELGADVHARSQVRRRRIGTELGGYNAAASREIDKGGYTPLLFAVQQGTLESVKLLLAAGADVNDTAPEGTSALVVAAHSGHGPVAAFLLAHGADPNADGAGYTALHAAILRGDAELVKALLARGANPNAALARATPARRNSADYALEFGLVGASPFWLAAQFLEPAIMRILLENGADASFVMKGGVTPVMASVQARRRVEPGFTADPIRDEQLVLDAVTIALDQGVDVNAAGKDGNTALHGATSRRLNRVIERLVERGATIDARNEKGQTPLALAATGSGNRASANGSDVNATAQLLRKLGAKEE
jgi:ankyrin repeat protein